MKISYMLNRENFYEINQKTLDGFFGCSKEKTKLYIYPNLNAIVTKFPSKSVKAFIYDEYKVSGFFKRMLVKLYAWFLLNSFGLFSSKRIDVSSKLHDSILIYPCNRKIRIFDFKKGVVSVVIKSGFPDRSLKKEIDFRLTSKLDFVPNLISHDDIGYTESIIDGISIARTGKKEAYYMDKAYALWYNNISSQVKNIKVSDYLFTIVNSIKKIQGLLQDSKKTVDFNLLSRIIDFLVNYDYSGIEYVPIGLSHGDLQPGNIWIENFTDKIYIIDWESFEERSLWYDQYVLQKNIRRNDCFVSFMKELDVKGRIVLLEDIVYRMYEVLDLPYDYGTSDFNAYLNKIESYVYEREIV